MLLLFDSPGPSFSPSQPQIDFNEKEDDEGDKEGEELEGVEDKDKTKMKK